MKKRNLNSNATEVIDKKRIITGFLREAEILGLPISLESSSGEIFHGFPIVDNEKSFFVKGAQPKEISKVSCVFSSGDGLVRFTAKILDVAPHGVQLAIPDELEVIQQRGEERFNFQDQVGMSAVAEVLGAGVQVYGELVDFTKTHFRVRTHSSYAGIDVQSEVLLKGYTLGKEIISTHGYVDSIRKIPNGFELLISRRETDSEDATPREERKLVPSGSSIKVEWPIGSDSTMDIEIVNVGLFGFCGAIQGIDPPIIPVDGRVLIKDFSLYARLTWNENGILGFDLRDNSRDELAKWFEFSDKKSLAIIGKPKKAKQKMLFSLMMKSGYLKGFKADLYREANARDSLIVDSNSRSWIKRFGENGGWSGEGVHVSFLRTSDNSWHIQELGNMKNGEKLGRKVLNSALIRCFEEEMPFSTTETMVTGIFDPQNQFNRKFWIRKNYESNTVNALVLKYKDGLYPKTDIPGLELITPTLSTWANEYDSICKSHNPVALNAVGLFRDRFGSPELHRDMLSSGHFLRRKVLQLKSQDRTLAVLVKLGLPTLSNMTVGGSHIWMSVAKGVSLELIMSHFLASRHAIDLMKGVLQFVILCDDKLDTSQIEGQTQIKHMSFIGIPITQIPHFIESEAADV